MTRQFIRPEYYFSLPCALDFLLIFLSKAVIVFILLIKDFLNITLLKTLSKSFVSLYLVCLLLPRREPLPLTLSTCVLKLLGHVFEIFVCEM